MYAQLQPATPTPSPHSYKRKCWWWNVILSLKILPFMLHTSTHQQHQHQHTHTHWGTWTGPCSSLFFIWMRGLSFRLAFFVWVCCLFFVSFPLAFVFCVKPNCHRHVPPAPEKKKHHTPVDCVARPTRRMLNLWVLYSSELTLLNYIAYSNGSMRVYLIYS